MSRAPSRVTSTWSSSLTPNGAPTRPPGCVARQASFRREPGLARAVGSLVRGRRRSPRSAVRGPPSPTRESSRPRPGPSSRDTDHPRARGRRQLVRAVRRRWTGRRHGQAERRDRCARQAHNAQGQAPASSFCAESVDRDPARSTICQEEVAGRVQTPRPR